MLVYAGRSAKRAQLSSSSSTQRAILVRVDLRRHARRIVLQPDLFHTRSPQGLCALAPVTSSVRFDSAGHRLSSSRGCAALFGWMPSACIKFGSSATPPERNRPAARHVVGRARRRAHGTGRRTRGHSSAACACRPAPPARRPPAPAPIMASKFSRTCLSGKPRRPSLPPSSRMTMRRLVQLQRARQPCSARRPSFRR